VWRGCEYGLQFGGEAGRGPGKRAYVTSRDGNIRAGLIRRGTSPPMLERERNPCASRRSARLRASLRRHLAPASRVANRLAASARELIELFRVARIQSTRTRESDTACRKYTGQYKPRRA